MSLRYRWFGIPQTEEEFIEATKPKTIDDLLRDFKRRGISTVDVEVRGQSWFAGNSFITSITQGAIF